MIDNIRSGSQVIGLGHHAPVESLTNADLAKTIDTSDEWIRSRVGIQTRRIAAPAESVADMATAAGRMALADAQVAAADIDFVVVATLTAHDRSPNTAGRVAVALGLESPVILDVNVACSGFVHAVALADQAIRCGTATTALVIGAEKLSAWTDWTDRSTSVLVGDGAGAVVLTATAEPSVGPVTWGSETDLTSSIRIEAPTDTFAQDGRSIMRWALTRAADRVGEILERSSLAPSEIDVFVPHQANLRIIEPLAEAAGLSGALVLRDVVESGNTSAASIPLAFSKAWHRGEIEPGSTVLLFGFGGGFAYAGLVVRAPLRDRSAQ